VREKSLQDPCPDEFEPLCAGRCQVPTPDSYLGSWKKELHIGYLNCNRVKGSGRQAVITDSPVLTTVVPGTCICVCSWCSNVLHLLLCVQGVIAVPRVSQRNQRDVHGVRLRSHDADVLVYDICVITRCRNFRASVVLSRWVLCGPSLLDWSDTEYAFLFWIQEGVPDQFCMSPGMWWYTAVGLYTIQGISDKLRELTHYDHGTLVANQALYGIQDTL